MSVRILEASLLATLQDAGRRGFASLGVGQAGPMDDVAARLANALVGNPVDATVIEMCLRGASFRFDAAHAFAFAGADIEADLDGRPVGGWRALHARSGAVLRFGALRRGAFGYFAIAGGIASPRILNSAATDLNAGIGIDGGRTLRAGDHLHIGDASVADAVAANWSLDPEPWFDGSQNAAVHAIRGTHFDALDARAQTVLFTAPFHIGVQSNRVGYRLEGTPLQLAETQELVSEPVARGTVQLPPGGTPIALMAEHPTIGGYPRIAHIAAIDWPRLAQRRIGAEVSLREIAQDDAQSRYLRRERELARLIEAIERRRAE